MEKANSPLEVLGQATQQDMVAGGELVQRPELREINSVRRSRDRIAVGTGGRVIQENRDARFHLVRDDPLQCAGLVVGSMPWQAKHVDQEPFGEPMPSDELDGDPLALRGEPQLPSIGSDEAVAPEPLDRFRDRGGLTPIHRARAAWTVEMSSSAIS
jgi:hypothetical protein